MRLCSLPCPLPSCGASSGGSHAAEDLGKLLTRPDGLPDSIFIAKLLEADNKLLGGRQFTNLEESSGPGSCAECSPKEACSDVDTRIHTCFDMAGPCVQGACVNVGISAGFVEAHGVHAAMLLCIISMPVERCGYSALHVLQVASQINTFLLAGYETTASSLAFTVYHVAKSPEAEAKLLAEIDSFGRDRLPSLEDLDQVGCIRCTDIAGFYLCAHAETPSVWRMPCMCSCQPAHVFVLSIKC